MRFLHAADLHLDSPLRSVALRDPDLAGRLHDASRQVLARIVDLAIERRVDALLLAGDVFDNGVPDVATRTVLARALGRLGAAGIPTVLIRGNHDGLLDPARYGALGDSVFLLDADRPSVEIGAATIHGTSHSGGPETRSLLPRYPAPVPGRINLGLMHCSPDGTRGHDPYAPCAVSDLLEHGYDYWALGHIHARQEWRGDRALVVMPGIPQGRHIRESRGGSVTLVRIDGEGPQAEELPVGLVGFREVSIDLPGDDTQTARLHRIADGLRGAAEGPTVLRVTLAGPGAQPFAAGAGDARHALSELAAEIGELYLDRVRVAPDLSVPDDAAAGDLVALMRLEAGTAGFREEAARMLSDLRDALPPEARDAIDDDTLEGLMADGLAAVAARLSMARSE
ncbi:exonuclease SbcD [Palleronia salina]|uniref:Exonuclease SbcD n=1 Tax=Palleronia salina TaxID=313368 RepID=A0A1M6LLB6_9RHOB|nr:DNA repair exonuclease [Palleronia salina]SHJ71965.1 exonuclease SbcD [Palleronia salina]